MSYDDVCGICGWYIWQVFLPQPAYGTELNNQTSQRIYWIILKLVQKKKTSFWGIEGVRASERGGTSDWRVGREKDLEYMVSLTVIVAEGKSTTRVQIQLNFALFTSGQRNCKKA